MNKGILELRGLFILLIFLFHAGLLPVGGTFGVTAFFILSGFSNTLGYKSRITQSTFSYQDYVKSRLIKFYPLHWLLLLPALISQFYSGYSVIESTLILIANFLLIHSFFPIKDVFFSYNAVSWYLSVTVFCVLIFPFLFRFVEKRTWQGKIGLFAVSLLIYLLLFFMLPRELIHPIMYINPIVRTLDFMLGMYIALSYESISKMSVSMYLTSYLRRYKYLVYYIIGGVLCLSLVLYSSMDHKYVFMSIIYWIPCIILLIIGSIGGGGEACVLQGLGKISFEFFLIHQLCMNAITKISNAGYLTIGSRGIHIIISFITAILLSTVLHLFFTVPLTKRLKVLINVNK